MPVQDRIEHFVEVPEGVDIQVSDNGDVAVSGPFSNNSLVRNFTHSKVILLKQGNGILVRVDLPRRNDKAIAGTWAAHLRNMIKGMTEGFTYRLKALYSHFPMSLKVDNENSKFIVNNYFGEKVPRVSDILPKVEVKVENKIEVIVSGANKEDVGQTAANIERSTTVKKRDRRVFQDGIYLIAKE